MSDDASLGRPQTLLERFSHLGIGADIAALSLIELWGLHCVLRRLAEEE